MLPSQEGDAAMDLGPSGFGLAIPRNVPSRPQVKSSQEGEGASAIRALTRSVRRGEPEAFSRFYDLYSFRLYKFLLVLARGDEGQAREVCQVVFIKLAKRFEEFDEEGKLWAWLCTVAKNTFIDDCRARQRGQRFVPLEEGFAQLDGDSPSQFRELLRDALTCLTPEERELLQAAYVDERPLRELAGAPDQTCKAVQSRLARLRRKLKEQLLKNLRHENQS
jgi:RNA polymerase sigma-70 factor (ECF subfamily)